jgi:hypothetical protein
MVIVVSGGSGTAAAAESLADSALLKNHDKWQATYDRLVAYNEALGEQMYFCTCDMMFSLKKL